MHKITRIGREARSYSNYGLRGHTRILEVVIKMTTRLPMCRYVGFKKNPQIAGWEWPLYLCPRSKFVLSDRYTIPIRLSWVELTQYSPAATIVRLARQADQRHLIFRSRQDCRIPSSIVQKIAVSTKFHRRRMHGFSPCRQLTYSTRLRHKNHAEHFFHTDPT
jgi:hypothetical protein